MKINYDVAFFLDAEALAEGGISEAYQKVMPELMRYIPDPVQIEEIINDANYAILAQGTLYSIFPIDEFIENAAEQNLWGIAAYVFFKIINDQLIASKAPVLFYAINGGNDLAGIFLSPADAKATQTSLRNPKDWPYLITPNPPYYGAYPSSPPSFIRQLLRRFL